MGTDEITAPQDAPSGTGNSDATACMLIIGNEVLSGRTQDKNLSFLGTALGEIGIDMREARIIPDDPAIIIETVNDCRARFDYVFTTGGIGPTHDDITADCVAEAFGVPLEYHPEAMARLTAHYETMGTEFNEARQRMARIPKGGGLIDNPVSTAPGFVIENVYVMAGVPKIMQAMVENILPTLKGGEQLSSITVSARCLKAKSLPPWVRCRANMKTSIWGSIRFTGLQGRGSVSWRVPAIRHASARLRRE